MSDKSIRLGVITAMALTLMTVSAPGWGCLPQVPNFTVFGAGAGSHPARSGPSVCATTAPVMKTDSTGFGGSWQNVSATAEAGRFSWETHGYNATSGDATYYGSVAAVTRFLVTGPAESVGLSLNLEAAALNELVSGASTEGGTPTDIWVSIFVPGGSYLLNENIQWNPRTTPGTPVEDSLASTVVPVPTGVELVLELRPSPGYYMNQASYPTPAEYTNTVSVELRATDVFSFDAEGFSVHMPGLNVYDNQWLGTDPQGLHARFLDVPTSHWAFSFIETFSDAGITAGCGGFNYCPNDPVTRAQMAVFIERAMRGWDYAPPAPSGVFLDVPTNGFAANYIEQLYTDGITGGCGSGNYCPGDAITRAQMAVFLLRAEHGSAYTPPAASGNFGDVSIGYWAAAWIEQLAAEGITGGCGGGNYCPNDPVTRAQMAVFLVRTFGL